MPKIFATASLEEIIQPGPKLGLLHRLFERGVIHGCQVNIGHPSCTPGAQQQDVGDLFSLLPGGFEVFFQFPSGSRGVDVGIRLDEHGVFKEYRQGPQSVTWTTFNHQAFGWARDLLKRCPCAAFSYGVAHGGFATIGSYRLNHHKSRTCATEFIGEYADYVVLETVPPVLRSVWVPDLYCPDRWSSSEMRAFGGTPECMDTHLKETKTRCLIDFTSLCVTWNQIRIGSVHDVNRTLRSLDGVVREYMALPHCQVCHFSGIPSERCFVPSPDYFMTAIPPCIIDAMATMDIICLEIPWNELTSELVDRWLDTYGTFFKH